MDRGELKEIIDTYKWIKVKQYDGDSYDTLMEHHKNETEFLINKCRELAKLLLEKTPRTFGDRNMYANIVLRSTDNGGREGYIANGYRPHLVFDNDVNEYKTSASHTLIGTEMLFPGEAGPVFISLLSGDYEYKAGETFKLYEGSREIGHGKVMNPNVNEILLR